MIMETPAGAGASGDLLGAGDFATVGVYGCRYFGFSQVRAISGSSTSGGFG